MIIPVLDVKNGRAVSGKSGKRETYQPLKTVFHGSSDPHKIAEALVEAGASRLYIADLDAIEKTGSNFDIIERINREIPVMLDAGAYDVNVVKKTLKVADKVIVATETLRSLSDLDEIFSTIQKEKMVLSIDVKDDIIFSKYLTLNFKTILQKIDQFEVDEIILLDISRVGTGKGVNQGLIMKFREFNTSLIVGGGVTYKDIGFLTKLGVNKFLVGSSLHSGNLLKMI